MNYLLRSNKKLCYSLAEKNTLIAAINLAQIIYSFKSKSVSLIIKKCFTIKNSLLKMYKSTLLKTFSSMLLYITSYVIFGIFNSLPNPMNMDQIIDDYFVINAFCHINHKAHEYQSAITLSLSS